MHARRTAAPLPPSGPPTDPTTVGAVRVLLVSTYELGHQPVHLAVPAAALLAAGHQVRCVDLAVGAMDDTDLDWADAMACSVPMHTAMRLTRPLVARAQDRRPELPVCVYGLYATTGCPGASRAIAGEYVDELVAWVNGLGSPRSATIGSDAWASTGDRAALPHCNQTAQPDGDRAAQPDGDRAAQPWDGGQGQVPDVDRSTPDRAPGNVGQVTPVVVRRSSTLPVPARHLLPPLTSYARVVIGGHEHLVGAIEASRGCAHRCRHCPVPVVYDGRTRVADLQVLLADIEQLVALGAQHVSFADPDFLNGPHHARRVVDALHHTFPDLGFDVTVKVEHILAHRGLWRDMAAAGCRFVTTAFESAEDAVLARLAKGHTVADALEAIRTLRSAGIEPRPSFVPFTPWTTRKGVIDLLAMVAYADLIGNVDPVQLSIRLLLPPGSLLLDDPEVASTLIGYDDEQLGWQWRAPDAVLDTLQADVAALAERAATDGWTPTEAFDAVWRSASDTLGIAVDEAPPMADPTLRSPWPVDQRPRTTEAWFCCAEPTAAQCATVIAGSP